jgi:O-antigen/teichoic acid export membrane protein
LTLVLGARAATSHGEIRAAGIARGALSTLAAQAVALAAGLVAVAVATSYLGAERYGAWATIASLVGWAALADFGVGSHLTTAVAAARGREDVAEARSAISSAFFLLCGIALCGLALTALARRVVPWERVLNVESGRAIAEVGPAVVLCLAGAWLGLPLTVADRTYTSYQEGAAANAWAMVASGTTLGALVLASRTAGGLVAVAGLVTCAALLVRGLGAASLFGLRHPELRPRLADLTSSNVSRVVAGSGEFFLVQIAALVLFSTDNVIIAQVLGAEAVTPYAVAWRLFAIPNLALTAAFPYLWVAYSEALARGDRGWVVRIARLSVWASTAVAAALSLPLVLYGQPIIRAWAGAEAVPPAATLAWMAAWNVVLAPANAVVCLLNAMGRIRWQIAAGLVSAGANIAVSIWWARAFGITGVIAATVVTYVLCAGIPVVAVGRRALGEIGRGDAAARKSGT